ncbi:MAG: tetratricopeptide repeat protein [Fimbriimonadaceae bacterium]
MVGRFSAFAVFALLSVAAWSQSREVIVVQVQAPTRGESQPNVPLAELLAQKLDEEGRVVPIVWSLADPVFRAISEQGMSLEQIERPTERFALQQASKLKIPHVLVLTAVRNAETGMVDGHLKLMRNGREVWSEKVSFQADVFSPDYNNQLETVARTWALQLGQGPLSNFAARPVPPRDEAVPPVPQGDPVIPPVRPAARGSELVQQGQDRLAEGRTKEGLLLLQQAIDAEPLDFERRQIYIDALLSVGRVQLAAREAAHCAALFPDRPEVRLLGARALLNEGKLDEALAQANEVLARGERSDAVLILLGDIAIQRGQNELALKHFTEVAENAPEKAFRMSLAAALNGNRATFDRYLAQMPSPAIGHGPRLLLAPQMEAILDERGGEIRSLIQEARVRPGEQQIVQQLNGISAQLGMLDELASRVTPPGDLPESWPYLQLAVKLMRQSAAEVVVALRDRDMNGVDDASLTLGEAFRAVRNYRALETEARERLNQPDIP